MIVRRTSSLLAVVVATAFLSATLSFSGPAEALSVPSDVGASPQPSKLSCPLQLIGVNDARRLVIRLVTNATIDEEKTTGVLPFDPKAMALFDFKALSRGYRVGVRAISPGHSPSVFKVTQLDSRPGLTYTNERMLNAAFNPHVFAGSGGYFVFAVSPNGKVVKRWSTLEDRRGRLTYDDHKLVTTHAPRIQTLSFSIRKKLDGVTTDVLWGTTVDGGLIQLRVPVDHPARAKVVTVKQSGFDSVTGLSMSYCGQHPSTLSFVAIDRAANAATWYTLVNQFSPRAKNLVDRGLVGDGADWHLHATF